MNAMIDPLRLTPAIADNGSSGEKLDRLDQMISLVEALLVEDVAELKEQVDSPSIGTAELQTLLTLLERGTVLAEHALKLAKLRDARRSAVPAWALASRRVTLSQAN